MKNYFVLVVVPDGQPALELLVVVEPCMLKLRYSVAVFVEDEAEVVVLDLLAEGHVLVLLVVAVRAVE